MTEERKKKKIPEYIRKTNADSINTLLLYFPTKNVKALKISIVILLLLIPIVIIVIILGIIRDFKWLYPLLILIFGVLFLIIIFYKGAIILTIFLVISLLIWWFFIGLLITWTEPSGFSQFMKIIRIPILIINILCIIFFNY